MSRGAQQFVTPLTFQAVSGKPVRTDLWDEAAEAAMGHIELARWADEIVVAPATAEFIARLAHGFADDLLTTLCSCDDSRPISIAPAMNRQMWANRGHSGKHQAAQESVAFAFSGRRAANKPAVKSGVGSDARAGGDRCRAVHRRATCSSAYSQGLKVVVTAGPTRERIDPVRFISNRSSGKMGYAVAEAARDAGARRRARERPRADSATTRYQAHRCRKRGADAECRPEERSATPTSLSRRRRSPTIVVATSPAKDQEDERHDDAGAGART